MPGPERLCQSTGGGAGEVRHGPGDVGGGVGLRKMGEGNALLDITGSATLPAACQGTNWALCQSIIPVMP